MLQRWRFFLQSGRHEIRMLLDINAIAAFLVCLQISAAGILCTAAMQSLHVDWERLTGFVSFFLLFMACGACLAGQLFDRYQGRWLILSGFSLMLTGGLMIIFSKSLFVLLIARIAEGTGAGFLSVMSGLIFRKKLSAVSGITLALLALSGEIG